MAEKRKVESALFSYKSLRMILVASGSLMIAIGPLYAYFIVDTVGFSGLVDVIVPFIFAILAVPAGIFVCITGKKLHKPIIEDK